MDIEIDVDSPTPVYEQLTQQIIQGVLAGTLSAGDAMPSIRQLASDLELNPNTVAKAYRQLETQRVLLTAGRRGTFIHDKAATQITKNNSQGAEFQLDELVASLSAKGMSASEICTLLKKQLLKLKE